MILVDTSVWIDHLRERDADLQRLLDTAQILCHRLVIGELAMGQFRKRAATLQILGELPKAHLAYDEEVLSFVEESHLFGMGIGFIDAHLLASVRLTPGSSLWTRDKRMLRVAEELRISLTKKL